MNERPGCLETLLVAVLFFGMIVLIARAAEKDRTRRAEEEAKIQHVDVTGPLGLKYVDFDGHRYVVYSQHGRGGVTHAPTCPCMNKEEP